MSPKKSNDNPRLARAMKRAETSRREAIRRLESLAVRGAAQPALPDVDSGKADIRRVFDALDTNFAGGLDAMKKLELVREDRLAFKIARAMRAEATPRPPTPPAPVEAAPPAPAEAMPPPPVDADPLAVIRTGTPGRPTPIYLVEHEFKRRVATGEIEAKSCAAQSRILAAWHAETHPNLPRLTPKTIENHIRADYRKAKQNLK